MPSPDDPDRGLIGIMRDNAMSYKPVFNFIEWDPQISMFLLWLWMISFFIGIINMLPLPILDGGKFLYTIIEKNTSERKIKCDNVVCLCFYFGYICSQHSIILRKVWMVYDLRERNIHYESLPLNHIISHHNIIHFCFYYHSVSLFRCIYYRLPSNIHRCVYHYRNTCNFIKIIN